MTFNRWLLLIKARGVVSYREISYCASTELHLLTPLCTVSVSSQVAPVIKARMMEYGTTMVSYQPQGNNVNFFRMVISNPAATFEDIDFLIEEIERLGQDL